MLNSLTLAALGPRMADLIYLACPYSHPDETVRAERFELACRLAADLTRQGSLVFSPLSHCVPIAKYGLGGDWAYWARHNTEMLRRCDRLVVIAAAGWKESVGVQSELKIAETLGLPVEFLEIDLSER